MSPPCRVSGGFVLLAGWFALVNGWGPLAVVLAASAVHELGHWLVLRGLGAEVTGFCVSALGAVLETDSGCLSYAGELAAVLAGPGGNLLAAAVLAAVGHGRWNAAVGANLILCVFNLLPVRPLDGGRALYLAAAWLAGPEAGEAAARWLGGLTALALAAALGWVMWRSGGSLWLLPLVCGGLYWGTRPWFSTG